METSRLVSLALSKKTSSVPLINPITYPNHLSQSPIPITYPNHLSHYSVRPLDPTLTPSSPVPSTLSTTCPRRKKRWARTKWSQNLSDQFPHLFIHRSHRLLLYADVDDCVSCTKPSSITDETCDHVVFFRFALVSAFTFHFTLQSALSVLLFSFTLLR